MAAKPAAVALETAGYLASNEQLTALAQEYAIGLGAIAGVRLSYLRILVAHTRHAAGRRLKKLTTSQTRKLAQETHDKLYAVVLTAVTTPDISVDDKLATEERSRRAMERNRRSNFARTAKHALDSYIDAGGKLAALDPKTVTKELLRRSDRTVDRGGTRGLVRSVTRTSDRVVKLVTQLAEENRKAARQLAMDLLEKLQPFLAKPLTRKTMRRGELTLHPEVSAH